MKRRPLRGRRQLETRPAPAPGRPNHPGCPSPFQPHQGQRGSNQGPLVCLGFPLGYQEVLECDELLRILEIRGFDFLRKKPGWN